MKRNMKRNILLIIALVAFTFSIFATRPVGAMTYDADCLSNASSICKIAGVVAGEAAQAMGLSWQG